MDYLGGPNFNYIKIGGPFQAVVREEDMTKKKRVRNMQYEMTQPALPGFEDARQGTPTKECG